MPSYDYCCKSCDETFEIRHSFKETPIVICPACQSRDTHKVPSLVGISVHTGRSNRMDQAHDQVKRNLDMKEEMRRDMGIEKIAPLRGSTMKQVYDDAKAQSSYIKESMSAQAEQRAAEKRVKNKEWTRKALQRTPERAKIKADFKAKEAARKRAIRI